MRSGQALLEMVVAIVVLTTAVVALAQIVTKSTANATYSRQQSQATGYATQGLEWIRSQRDGLGWDQFSQLGGSYCLATLAWTAGDCGPGVTISGTDFTRSTVINGTATSRQAQVTVSWPAGGRTAQVVRTTVLTRY